jgi:hypothetical protein
VYNASVSGNLTFTSLTFPVDPDNGDLRNINGTVSGTGTGTVTISNGAGLSMAITVNVGNLSSFGNNFAGGSNWSHGTQAGDFNVVSTTNYAWTVELLRDPAPSNVFLMTGIGNNTREPSQNPVTNPVSWDEVAGLGNIYYTSRTGTSSTLVYIIIPTNANFNGVVKYTYLSGGQNVARYYMLQKPENPSESV